jgi:hypothetical protein
MSHHRVLRKGLQESVVGPLKTGHQRCAQTNEPRITRMTDLQETEFCLVDLGFFSFRSAFIREIRG